MDQPEYARRTPEQLAAAAAAMDRARTSGLPADVLSILLTARRAWWGQAPWPPRADLIYVLTQPAARGVDELLWREIRRRVR